MLRLLEWLKRLKGLKKGLDEYRGLLKANFDEIWQMNDKNDFLIALDNWVCKKSNGGDEMEKLSQEERTFFLVFQLEAEVNNGGFSQFFYNSSGDFANETVAALREIGAEKMAKICERALALLGGAVPENRSARTKMLDEAVTDEVDEALSRCDDAFCEYPDNLLELNYQYIVRNRNQFT